MANIWLSNDTFFMSQYAGQKLKSTTGSLWRLQERGFVGVSTSFTSFSETLTGVIIQTSSGSLFFQTTSNCYIEGDDFPNWQDVGNVTYTNNQAQRMVEKLIKNDYQIFTNNLICARYANKMSSSQRKMLYSLQKRLEARQQLLNENPEMLTGIKYSQPDGYVELAPYLQSFMNNPGISIAITLSLTAVITTAIVVAALSTAAYFLYKNAADESASDVKFSNELTKALTSKLTEEEYAQLKQETGGIVTRATIRAKLASLGTGGILLAAAAAGFIIFPLIKNFTNKEK